MRIGEHGKGKNVGTGIPTFASLNPILRIFIQTKTFFKILMSILDKILAWSDPELIVLGVSLAMKGQITLSKDRNVRARPFEIELA